MWSNPCPRTIAVDVQSALQCLSCSRFMLCFSNLGSCLARHMCCVLPGAFHSHNPNTAVQPHFCRVPTDLLIGPLPELAGFASQTACAVMRAGPRLLQRREGQSTR